MTDTELDGLGEIERVPLPFRRQTPVYRIRLRVILESEVDFSTWVHPDEYLESDDNMDPLIQDVINNPDDIEVESWGIRVEQLQEDGSWTTALDEERIETKGGYEDW